MYTCIVGRESTLTASWVASRIRDSAAAVHETAATLGFMLKKEQEKVIVAFTQGHDVFVALPTGFGNSLCCCCLSYVFYKLRGFTNAVVVSPLKRNTMLLTVLVYSLASQTLSPCVSVWLARLALATCI